MNNDLISRSYLKKAFEDYEAYSDIFSKTVYDIIDNAPTISLSTPSDIDELCRLRSDLKSGLYVGSTLRTQAQMNKFVEVLDKIIGNAPTVAVNCKDCDGYEAGYSAGVRDTERPQGEWENICTLPVIRKCSLCGVEQCGEQTIYDNFCPNCGARMVSSDKTQEV